MSALKHSIKTLLMPIPDQTFHTSSFWNDDSLCVLSGDSPPTDLDLPSGAVLFHSSGSSGVEKWIVHTRASLLASARAVNAHLQVNDNDTFALLLPHIHVGGFGILARAYAANAKCAIFPSKWNPIQAAEFLAKSRATITSLVPTQVYDLVQSGIQATPSLRAVIVGGGTLSTELGTQARNLGWPVLQSYGMSEAGSQVATASLDSLSTPYSHNNLPILPVWQVSTNDDHQLVLTGDALCAGIISRHGDSVRYSSHTQYLTSDRVTIHDGTLTFLGRQDRTIKIKGELVNLDALENTLEETLHQKILLLTTAHPRDGHSLHAFSTEPATAEDINMLLPLYAQLTSYQHLSEFPLSPLGKINRRALLQLLTTQS